MKLENLTLEDVFTAYRKLKSSSYYDTYDLFLKDKIALFETEAKFTVSENLEHKVIDFESKLKKLHQALTVSKKLDKIDYWNRLYENIRYRILPKQIKSFDDYKDEKETKSTALIKSKFTNKREIPDGENYEFEKLTFFIDAPIELHLVSILWIMKQGYLLESDLHDKCYGNRLILEKIEGNNKKERLVNDDGLFKPYYKQYQRWRDEGVTVAKNYLDDKQNVLFLNVDIKDYYYSIRLNFRDLDKRLHEDYLADFQILNEVFEKIHIKYTNLIKETKYPDNSISNVTSEQTILPIGLASSYVLANWYLHEFDSSVLRDIKPIYYSRYVDDIFIITANPELGDTIKNESRRIDFEFQDYYIDSNLESLASDEQFLIKTLYPVITLENTPRYLLEANRNIGSKIFKLQAYENLYIQPSKTLVYFFEHDSSLAMLEKFKRDIEKRSSEFRFLPDEELAGNGFDDEAYELVYDDSLNKVKTLKDYKENKYGIASHLSKKIFFSLRNGKSNNKEDSRKILKFFSGTTNLEHFSQWERLLTYFIVNDNVNEFIEFTVNTMEQIFKLPLSNQFQSYNLKYSRIAVDLLEHFSIAMEMALALNPIFLKSKQKKLQKLIAGFTSEFNNSNNRTLKSFNNWQRFRLSNMIRHNYVNIPLLNYLEIPLKTSLIESDFSRLNLDGIEFGENLLSFSPRKVKFCEVALMESVTRIYKTKREKPYQHSKSNDVLFSEINAKNYLDYAFEIYYRINYWFKSENDVEFKNQLKLEIFKYDEVFNIKENCEDDESVLIAHEISVNQKKTLDTLTVGLANMKVWEKNYEASMLGKPIVENRYLPFAKILNEAEEEKCDLVVLPELSLPHSNIKTVIEYSWKHQRAIISGIEHWNHNDVIFNFILTILPVDIRGIKDAVPILRLKNHYSPSEEFWINGYRKTVPKAFPSRYQLLRWQGLYFTNYYCFELADIVHRSIFRSKIDFLVASEWNKDINFYSNITEATTRDLHCYFIQVNTSQYGDSRVTHPKRTENKDSLRIKGGLNTTLLVDKLDIKSLREFQFKAYGLQKDDKRFKPTPANYKHEDAESRQENSSFKR